MPASSRTPSPTRRRLRRLLALGALGAYLLVLLATVALVTLDVRRHRAIARGIETGLDLALASPVEPRFGVNVALERMQATQELRDVLRLVRLAGVQVVRQAFRWAELEPRPGEYRFAQWDEALPILEDEGLQVIAVLHTSPLWARDDWEADNPQAPPADLRDLARFAATFARRYAGRILAYQIWDQPNIHPHWGSGEIDPAGYLEMLRVVGAAIREADPDALIIAGGLAPNTEPGGLNMSDVLFLREIYRRGAGEHFDVLGYKAYGFWSGPYDRRVGEEVLNFSRAILLREEMVARGDAHKPIWAMEAGWAALPPDWAGSLPPQGSDSELVQSERLALAVRRIRREWPWMGLACMQSVLPDAPADDGLWGFSLLTPNREPTALFRAMQRALTGPQVLYPGTARHLEPYVQPWRASSAVSLEAWGTDVYLDVERGAAEGTLAITVDDAPRELRVDLGAPAPAVERLAVATGLALGTHRLVIRGDAKALAAVRAALVARADRPLGLWMNVLVGGLLVVWSGVSAWQISRLIPFAVGWRRVRRAWQAVPAGLRGVAPVAAFVAAAALPWGTGRLGALALYGLLALLAPEVSLLVAVATVPLAPLTASLGPGVFSVAEVSVLIAAGAWIWNAALGASPETGATNRRAAPSTTRILDSLVLLLVCLGIAATLSAEYRHVAARELRVVIVGAALLYALVRRTPDRARMVRLMDVLWASSVAVALYALLRYPSEAGVIAAEGVRRARALYGSPNNLALVMERALPLGLAVAMGGSGRWRRLAYGLGAVPVAAALALSFSRGALLLGVPAAVVALAILSRGRWRWAALGGLLLLAVALVPLVGTQRLASLLEPSQGTTFLRLQLWRSAWRMVGDHPWLGVGPDNFLYYYGDYILPGAEVDRWLSHPHNLLLDSWLRLGIGGPLAVGLLLAAVGWRALALLERLGHGDRRAMVVGLLAGIAAAVAHGMIDSFLFVHELALWLMVAVGWIATLDHRGPERANRVDMEPTQGTRV